MSSFLIRLLPSGRVVACPAVSTILDCCRENSIHLRGACGGWGRCRSCRVRVEHGQASEPTRMEERRLPAAQLKEGWRLACQARPVSDMVVYLPSESDPAVSHAYRADLLAAVRPDGLLTGGAMYGAAIDLGTTKIAGYLLDLHTGVTLASLASANPQAAFGDDVISRITFALQSTGNAERLRMAAAGAISGMIGELVGEAGVATGSVTQVVVCGNTVMHHLLLGLPVEQLAAAPFRPAVREAVERKGKEIGLEDLRNVQVYLLPNIWGYVGGDHVAVLAAARAADVEVPTLVIDIGTNTEISLALPGSITSVSCASGPAFEGGHISRGMKASPGAIDRVSIRDGSVRCHAIGGKRAVGICGSGLLDAAAAMLQAGVVDASGKMDKRHNLVRVTGGRPELLVSTEADITVTQEDVRELQLAKAAIRTGIDTLLADARIGQRAVKDVIVAGSFGNFIDVGSAVSIGMLPDLPHRRYKQVGNAAGAGACLALVSNQARNRIQEMAVRVRYLELAGSEGFMQTFVEAMKLGPG